MRTVVMALLVVGVLSGCTALSDPTAQSSTCTEEAGTAENPTISHGTSNGPAEYSALTGGVGGEGYVPAARYDGDQPAVVPGKDIEANVAVSNREREPTEYTIVVQLQGYTYGGEDNRTLTIRNRTTLTRWSVTVPDGDRTETSATFTVPNASAGHHRLAMFLYDCSPAETPTAEHTITEPWYIGVNVTNATDSSGH